MQRKNNHGGYKMPRIKIGGKFSFGKLPKELQEKVKGQVKANENLSIKIDGKPVNKELIKELEAKAVKKVEPVKAAPKKVVKKK